MFLNSACFSSSGLSQHVNFHLMEMGTSIEVILEIDLILLNITVTFIIQVSLDFGSLVTSS